MSLRVVVVAALSGLVAACGIAPGTGGTGEALRIATISFEPGGAEFGGLSRPQAVEQAVRDINAAGGVLGQEVQLTVRYSGQTGERVDEAIAQVLGEDDAAAVIGPDNSFEALAVIDEVIAAPAVMCGAAATADELSAYADDGLHFRTIPPDRHQGALLARLVAEQGREPVTLFAQDGPYGEGLLAVVAARLRRRGIDFTEIVFNARGEDREDVGRRLVDSAPATVAALTHAGPALGALAQLGFGPRDVPVFVSDGLAMDEVFQHIDPSDPAATEGMVGVRPGHAGDHPERELVERVSGGHATAQAYDCAILVALAAEAAGSVQPTAIRDEMTAVSRDGEGCTTFAACAELLRAGADIDYDGVSGPIDFDEAGDPSVAIYHVIEFGRDGRAAAVDEVRIP